MKKLTSATIIFFITIFSTFAGDGPYAVKNIPVEIMANANVVKRTEDIRYIIGENNKAKLYKKIAYTILNPAGKNWGEYVEGYDKLCSIESFNGTLYDANGEKIRSLKKAQINDVSGVGDASLADDNRIKWFDFFYNIYPYTVEFQVELNYKGTMFLPNWLPQEREDMGVQQSGITVITPQANILRFKMFHYPNQPIITTDSDNNKVHQWEIKNIIAVKAEKASPLWHELTTAVFMATEKFMLGDHAGSNASWEDFGRFVYELKKDRDLLPDDVKSKVHELTDGIQSQKEKVVKLYQFMQQNTRYISIQLGVGGWQPFDAKYVATKKYGDCKALSNYMYSLLKEAGIRSVYTIIKAGENKNYLLTELPCSQFNHVILFVPIEKDTIWLECTSQTLPAGYLSSFTCNRYALAAEEGGGKLIKTPNYGLNENLQMRQINAEVDDEGRLMASVKASYRALQQDRLHQIINGLSKDKLMQHLKEDFELATYDIKSFVYKEEMKALPIIYEQLELVAENYATVSGKRLFITPNIFTRVSSTLKQEGGRKNELVLHVESKMIDTVSIKLPVGYSTEAIPTDVSIASPFGSYTSSVRLKDGQLIYYRSYEQYQGRFPASEYRELIKFYDAVSKSDRARVVLVKK